MSDRCFLSITFLRLNARFSVKSLHLALKFCIFAVNKITNKKCSKLHAQCSKPYQRLPQTAFHLFVAVGYAFGRARACIFVSLQLIMKRLEKQFPTFTITKGTDVELGRRLTKMGYEHKRLNKGSVFRVEEI